MLYRQRKIQRLYNLPQHLKGDQLHLYPCFDLYKGDNICMSNPYEPLECSRLFLLLPLYNGSGTGCSQYGHPRPWMIGKMDAVTVMSTRTFSASSCWCFEASCDWRGICLTEKPTYHWQFVRQLPRKSSFLTFTQNLFYKLDVMVYSKWSETRDWVLKLIRKELLHSIFL